MREFEIVSESREHSKIYCGQAALAQLTLSGRYLVFTDSNVYSLYRGLIAEKFGDCPVHVMSPGEEHKNEQTLFALLAAMKEHELHRGDRIVCLGGGVVGDIGGLAAALYMRGIACDQIPTTLLAQVDSSVGGKTAIDFCGVKNLVGVFNQPQRVFADPLFFGTLPPREIRCGLGEIVKHAALNGELYDRLLANKHRLTDLGFLSEVVADNIAIKADVVRRDAHEADLRKCLNLGHTTAHAFELSDGKLSHGEYVLVGILFEAEIARRRLKCDGAYLNGLQSLARAALGTMPALPDAGAAASLARLDKKNRSDGNVSLAVPVKRGGFALTELPFEDYKNEIMQIQEALC